MQEVLVTLLLSLAVCNGLRLASQRACRQHRRAAPPLLGAALPGPFAPELDEMLRRYKESLHADPQDAVANLNLGLVAKRKQNLPLASASLRRAAELLPENDDVKLELGDVLIAMGEFDDADALLRDLISREPPRVPQATPSRATRARAGLLLDARGQRSHAFEVYRAFGPDSPMALMAGVVADSLGEHAAAMTFYRQCWQQDPGAESTAMPLMVSHLREGDEASAAALRAQLPSHVAASVEYVLATAVGMLPSNYYFTYDMLRLAAAAAPPEGLVLEFGVYHGKSIRILADLFRGDAVHGFDTFSGIPEDWHFTRAGTYSTHGALPRAPDTVQYHVGLFSETLPGFLDTHAGPIRLMNIDCDLYSSTKDVLDAVADRLRPGSVLVFDEYVMNPHWQQDEFKAFQEAVARRGWTYRYLGISLVSQQAVVQLT